jgi:hypothetical protein
MALSGSTIATTFLKLLRCNADTMGAGVTASFIQDSADTDSCLAISTTRVGIGGNGPDNMLEMTHNIGTAVTGANIADNTIQGIHIDGPQTDTDGAGSVIKFSSKADTCQSAISHIQNTDDDGSLVFWTDNSGSLIRAMTINHLQDVALGNTGPIMDGAYTDSTRLTIYDSANTKRPILEFGSLETAAGEVVGAIHFCNSNNVDNTNFDANSKVIAQMLVETVGTTTSSGGNLIFYTKPEAGAVAYRMKIDSTGKVAIGNINPSTQLHVAADPGDNGTLVTFDNTHPSGDDADIILKLQFGGDVDVTNDTGVGCFVQFGDSNNINMGRIVALNATAISSTLSDYRKKENISPMSSGLTEMNNLKPSTFNFIGYPQSMTGFIAHEVQEVVPNAVFGAKDAVDDDGEIDPQMLSVEILIPFMVKAIQELSAKVTALENA